MLKAMANLILPASERRTPRHDKSPSPTAAAVSAAARDSSQQLDHKAPTTQRASQPSPIAGPDGIPPVQAAKLAAPPPVRTSSRKRRASALADDAPDARPPTKITITQPHGELVRITNGVPKPLHIGADDVPSGASTPGANGACIGATAQPATGGGADKRSLRSHDGGSRLKSDLAIYFSCYDDVITGVERPSESLDTDTRIYLIDEPIKTPRTHSAHSAHSEPSRKSTSPVRTRKASVFSSPRKPPSAPPPKSSTAYRILDYSTITKALPATAAAADPLSDAVYFTQHRRAERKEKQLRNIEKERAMHEKVQLERLLDGLLGPDWLRVMGITGVTDGERHRWEAKRAFFVREVESLVDKFRLWKEQEKRARAEREAAVQAAEEGDEGDESPDPEPRRHHPRHFHSHAHSSNHPPTPTSPSTAIASPTTTNNRTRRPPRPHGFLLPPIPPEPRIPFTSFFAKPHLRAAALGRHRQAGRKVMAFGVQVPEVGEREFRLPEEWVSGEALREVARERRRRRRGREGGGA